MSPRTKTGPRPQDDSVTKALDALVSGGVGLVADVLTAIPMVPAHLVEAGGELAAEKLRKLALDLLEAAGVDTAGLTITGAKAPTVKRIKRT